MIDGQPVTKTKTKQKDKPKANNKNQPTTTTTHPPTHPKIEREKKKKDCNIFFGKNVRFFLLAHKNCGQNVRLDMHVNSATKLWSLHVETITRIATAQRNTTGVADIN